MLLCSLANYDGVHFSGRASVHVMCSRIYKRVISRVHRKPFIESIDYISDVFDTFRDVSVTLRTLLWTYGRFFNGRKMFPIYKHNCSTEPNHFRYGEQYWYLLVQIFSTCTEQIFSK